MPQSFYTSGKRVLKTYEKAILSINDKSNSQGKILVHLDSFQNFSLSCE